MEGLFPTSIDTERLRLEVVDADATDVFEHFDAFADDPDPETVYEHVPLDPPTTPADSREFLERAASNRREASSVTYLIRPRSGEPGAGEIAGSTTLFVSWDRLTAEPGILLRKPFWGRGYAGERATALISLAFDRLDLTCFAVSCVASNEHSRRAIERYVDAHGGRYEGLLRNAHAIGDGPVDLHRYTISRAEYRSTVGDPEG